MTPRLSHIIIAAVLVIGLLGAVVFGVDAYRQHKGSSAERNAAVYQGEANAHQSAAQAQDPVIADLQAERAALKTDVGRLSKERDGLLRRLAAVSQSDSHSTGSNLSPVPPVGSDGSELSGNSGEMDLLRATVEKDAEVIESQDLLIKNQSELILVATKRGDEWKATAETRERQALAQEAATQAWKKAVTTSKWRGRVEGFAAGVALGYVARGQR